MKIKNTSGEDLLVPWLGGRLVIAGAVVEVPADTVTAYTQQEATWAPADDEAQGLHDEMLEGIAALLYPSEPEGGQPSGNASRDEWVTYVTGAGLATIEDLAEFGRDDIRDTYKEG